MAACVANSPPSISSNLLVSMAGAFRGLLRNSQCKATPATTAQLAESALLAAVLDLAPGFRDAVMASSSVAVCATASAAQRPGSLLTSHTECGARAGALRFAGRGGVGSFTLLEGACHE